VSNPLALDPSWPSSVPLLDLDSALEQTMFQGGLSREDLLRRLAADVQKPGLMPLLWLLPKRWKLAPAQLPIRLQGLAGIVERGLLSPLLLAAVADDLPHLLPPPQRAISASSLGLWQRDPSDDRALPTSLESWLAGSIQTDMPTDRARPNPDLAKANPRQLAGGLVWQNMDLHGAPTPQQQLQNSQSAQILNRLGANLLSDGAHSLDPWQIEGCQSSRQWIALLQKLGWQVRAQLRASVASFGLGASLQVAGQGWTQVPLALPMRTSLLNGDGDEQQTLLPHSCLELELRQGTTAITLQYYQGTEGICGWEALNDLDRPWQNNRHNGTVRYLGEPFQGDQLLALLDLCDWMALVHNHQSTTMQLRWGGYGSLGFCIDTSALLQQAATGQCDLFPVLLGGVWRERLLRCSIQLLEQLAPGLSTNHQQAAGRYAQALAEVPMDVSNHGSPSIKDAQRRLRACLPSSSPFLLVQQWNPPKSPGSPESP
jgi:hypothetical protein